MAAREGTRMALAELEHWLAEAARLQPLVVKREETRLEIADLEADLEARKAQVGASEPVATGKNTDVRAALLGGALVEDETYQNTRRNLRLAKLRLADVDGELEAQRARLGLVRAWWGRERGNGD